MNANQKLKNIYFERLVLNEDDFPYSNAQEFVQLTMRPIFLEWDNGTIEMISLTNEKIEYSLQTTFFEKDDLFSINAQSSKSNVEGFNQIVDCPIIKSYSLHLIDENEIEIDRYPNKKEITINDNLIGKKFLFKNGIELFIYCSEPEIIEENRFYVFRNSDIMCVIIDDKQSFLKESKDIFPREYYFKEVQSVQ